VAERLFLCAKQSVNKLWILLSTIVAAQQISEATSKAMFLRIKMPGFAQKAKNRREFAPERRPVEQIRRICEGIRGD
jgi:hypothetical protein